MRLSRFGIVTLAFCLSIGVATAGNFSFTGIFTQDDQLELFQFTAPSASLVVRTWGYAGGTNANGQVIAAGGFDPILSVFDATGGLLASSPLVDTNNDGAGVDTDPTTGYAFDSLLVLNSLNPWRDLRAGPQPERQLAELVTTYGDGFSQSGMGNFTAGEFGCGGTAPFCDATPAQRNGSWAVDITGVRDATDITNMAEAEPPRRNRHRCCFSAPDLPAWRCFDGAGKRSISS